MARTLRNDPVTATDIQNKTNQIPQIFIFPRGTSEEALIVTLGNSRYMVCPSTGIYEFKKITNPNTTLRSFLLTPPTAEGLLEKTNEFSEYPGYVVKNASLLIATAIDPLFMILPALAPSNTKASEKLKNLYLSGEDYLSKMTEISPQCNVISRMSLIKNLLEQRMAAVCDTVEAGDEKMYRFNEVRLLDELLKKAKQMITAGLPSNIEEKLVRRALEVPVLSLIKEQNRKDKLELPEEILSSPSIQILERTETKDLSSLMDNSINLLSEDSTVLKLSEKTTFQEAIQPIAAPDEVINLLRLRVALFFILSNYIAPHLRESLKSLVSSSTVVNFKPLDEHLIRLGKLRQEALATRSMSDFSRKRNLSDDAEAGSKPVKRHKEKEDTKKKSASASRAIKALGKINVSGMKKLNQFFTK